MEYQDNFENINDIEENIVSLCDEFGNNNYKII